MAAKREVAIIGATLDLGQGRRGVDMGPSAIRYAGLEERLASLGYDVRDHGNVETAVPEATALARRASAIPARDQGDVRADRGEGRRGIEGRCDAARPRRRPLGRARHARWPRLGARRRRRALDRRALGHQHARDEPERERPRDAAGCSTRPRWSMGSRARPGRCRQSIRASRGALGTRQAGRRRASIASRRRRSRLHDERDRPDRNRAGGA